MRIKNILLLFFCVAFFVQCNDNDEYYDEPSWLEKPLYGVLEAKGHFSNYLKLADRTPYGPVIKEGGLYTLFAPNDNAFATFLAEKGYASVDDIPQDEANAIIGYSMVFSQWTYTHLGDVFNGTNDQQYLTGLAIKKRTNYYPTIYQDPDFNNEWVIDQNRIDGSYDREYFSFKYLPVLTAQDYNIFFPDTPFSMDLYNANVYDAQVVYDANEPDGMIARNGVAHETNKVVLPLRNMDKYLYDAEYSRYKSLLDFKSATGAYLYKNYTEDLTLTEFFKKIHPEIGDKKIYVKSYNASYTPSVTSLTSDYLFFSPIYEQYAMDGTASPSLTETDGMTLFVPTDRALDEYLEEKIYVYYDNLSEVPMEAITALASTHMGEKMYWPSTFARATASTGEYINGVGPNGGGYEDMKVVDQQLTSNGFIYLIDRVIKSKWFETVYTRIFLDPQFSMLNRAYTNYFPSALRLELMESVISDGIGSKKFTLLLPNDQMLADDGFKKAISSTGTEILENSLIISGSTDDRMRKLMRMHVFQGYSANGIDTEIKSFDGDGPSQYDGWGFRVSYYGDLIRFKDGNIQATGNVDDGTYAKATLLETFDNGSVYSIEGDMLQYSQRHSQSGTEYGWRSKTLWQYLSTMYTEVASARTFIDYVEAAMKESADSDDLSGIGNEGYYTVLVVTNSSMNLARNKGLIPPIDSLRTGADDRINLAKQKALRFLLAHFLTGRVYADDGIDGYLYPYNANQPNLDLGSTSLRITNEKLGLINTRMYVNVSKNKDVLQFEPRPTYDETGQKLLVDVSNSDKVTIRRAARVAPDSFRGNRMAGNAVLHEVTGFFAFEETPTEP